MSRLDVFREFLTRWELKPDGDPITTHSSHLLPVRRQGMPAMLKVAFETDEKYGHVLLDWWDGEGAVRLLASAGAAILLERAEGKRSLAEFARSGRDDEASRIICDVIAKLHAPKAKLLPELVLLSEWFKELWPAASTHGGFFALSATTARELLASPREVGVLHGDVHHENVLDFGARGWLAIDPKRLVGERGFDYANLFCNPDYESAAAPGRFARRVEVVSEAAGHGRTRLLQWILAWAGLSAAWFIGDGLPYEIDRKIAELAAAELAR